MKVYDVSNMPDSIVLGRNTETGTRPIAFECSAWLTQHPDLTITVWSTLPNGGAAYPADTRMDGTRCVWNVNNADTSCVGSGTVELVGVADGKKIISAFAKTRVLGITTSVTSDPPAAQKPWVDEVLAAAEKAKEAVQVNVSEIEGGHRVNISDSNSTQTFDVLDGAQGEPGADGKDGTDATVTSESIKTALGYTPANQEDVNLLSEDIEQLKGGGGSGGGESVEVVTDVEIVVTDGKFAKWVDGDAGQQGGESSVNWAQHSQFIPVSPGDVLRISCKSGNACPGVVFYSTNTMSTSNAVGCALENPGTGDPASGSTNRYTYTDADVVVPAGAAYAILNNTDAYAGWKCQKVTVTSGGGSGSGTNDEYEIAQLERRVLAAEKHNDFAWGTFDKAYFIFVHDDSQEFIETAYNAFHAKGVPLSSAAIAPYLSNTHGGKTVKEWLDLIVADGGEVLCHYSYDLKESDADSVWYQYVVEAKREFERNGFDIRGLILAGSSDVNSAKGEKFCRRYFDYADKVGTTLKYNLGRKGMWTFADLDAFKARIDSCAQTPGIYAFGFHGNRDDETWVTEDSLKEIIDYIAAKGNCEITTYSAVFDSIGTTVLEKRIAALENGA